MAEATDGEESVLVTAEERFFAMYDAADPLGAYARDSSTPAAVRGAIAFAKAMEAAAPSKAYCAMLPFVRLAPRVLN